MRTATAGERTRMRTQVRQYHIKLEVRNISNTWIDVSRFVQGVTIVAGLDNPTVTATFNLLKVAAGQSAAPLMVGSTLNRDDLANYAPLFNSGNRIRAHVAVLAPAVAPVTADWHHVFEGKIDRPDWAPRTTMTVTCRDLGAYLLDNVIDEPRIYSTATGTFVEDVMQQVILDNAATDVLVVPDPPDPAWVITQYEQSVDVPVLTAIRDLANQIAWDVRYDYLPGDNFPQLLFYEPDRAKVTADDSFGPNEYIDVPTMGFDDEGVRNDIKLWFYDSSIGGKLTFRRIRHPGSILAFGRRFMQLAGDATKGIRLASEADRMLAGMILDTAIPYVDHSIQTKLWWPAQLGDLYAFPANNNHYDEEQKFAVIAYQHDLSIVNGVFTGNTVLTMRGQPSGGYRTWLEKAGPPGDDLTGIPGTIFGLLIGEGSSLGGTTKDGRVWWDVTFDNNTEFVKIWAEESPDQNVPNPDIGSEIVTAWVIYRPEGIEGSDRNFRTTVPMAIRPDWYGRFVGAGYNKQNVMGPLWTPNPVQARDNDPPYVDGVITDFTITPRVLQDGYVLSIDVGAIDPTVESWLFVERDRTVVFRIPLTAGGQTITLLDLGLMPSTARTYLTYIWTKGQSGVPFGWVVDPTFPGDVGPRFGLNSPFIIQTLAGRILAIIWECEDTLADNIEVQRSINLINWAVIAPNQTVAAPATTSGQWLIGDTSPAYYRLVSKSGSIYLTYTAPKWFDGITTLPGGPGTEPPILQKIIRLVNGFPQLVIAWTCNNGQADSVILEQSDTGAGVWTELLNSADIASGEYNAAPFTFSAKDYRMRAVQGATTLATSATLAYDGNL